MGVGLGGRSGLAFATRFPGGATTFWLGAFGAAGWFPALAAAAVVVPGFAGWLAVATALVPGGLVAVAAVMLGVVLVPVVMLPGGGGGGGPLVAPPVMIPVVVPVEDPAGVPPEGLAVVFIAGVMVLRGARSGNRVKGSVKA